MDKQLQPKLRFPEFRGDWESDKFKSYVKLNQGLQIPISERFTEYVPNSYFYITNEFLNKNSSKSYYIVNPSNSVICKESDILMTRTGNTGKVVTNVKGAFHNNFFKISYNSNVYKDFLYFYLIHPKIQHIILSRAGTSTIPDLNHSDFYSINFVHPSLTEQQKIANYLTTIDKKISLLEEKKTELLRYNKAMMQKLFAQEIRFKDENGNDYPEWEEKRLKEISKFRRGSFPQPYGLEKWYDDINGYPFVQVYDVNNNFRLKSKTKRKISELATKSSVFVPSGTLLVTIQGSIGRVAITDIDCYVDRTLLIISSIDLGLDINFYKYCLYILFEIEKQKAPGGTIKTITKEVLSEFKVPFPTLPEQQKIAGFLSAIDESITKVEEQIEETLNFKKAMLQQMFV